jgi:four helix bundle protein
MVGNWFAQGDKVGDSLMELDTQLQIATNLGYLDHEASTDLANQLQTVFAPLSGLTTTIKKRIAQHPH